MSELKWRKCSKCRRPYPATLRYFPPDSKQPLGIKYCCRACRAGKEWHAIFWRPPLGHKRCSRCAEIKTNAEFNRNAKAEDGLRSECKACQARDGHGGEYRLRLPLGMKRCPNCGGVFPMTREYYGYSKNSADGWNRYCKECLRAKSKAERKKPGSLQRQLIYKRRNREKINAVRRDRYKNDAQQRARRKAEAHRRAAKKKNLPATLKADDVASAMRYWENRCAYCGSQQGFWNPITLDHFIPLASGGGTVSENMVPACASCNASKRHDAPGAWVIKRFGRRKGGAILRSIEEYFDSIRHGEERAA